MLFFLLERVVFAAISKLRWPGNRRGFPDAMRGKLDEFEAKKHNKRSASKPAKNESGKKTRRPSS